MKVFVCACFSFSPFEVILAMYHQKLQTGGAILYCLVFLIHRRKALWASRKKIQPRRVQSDWEQDTQKAETF